MAAEINRDESVQASAIMRDGYEEIEVPLSLDDNTIAEIKDAVKENVEQSLDVSVQHFLKLPSRIIITRRKKFMLLPKRSVNS